MDFSLDDSDNLDLPERHLPPVQSTELHNWDGGEKLDVEDELAELTRFPSFQKRIRITVDKPASAPEAAADAPFVTPSDPSAPQRAKTLRQCRSIVRRFMAMKVCLLLSRSACDRRRVQDSLPFRRPVDPVAFGIPDYFHIIKQPMDLGTIEVRVRVAVWPCLTTVRLADCDCV